MSSKKQASGQMKFTQRELNRQQKLANTANLARLVRTDSSLMAQPPVKKPRTVSIANGNVIPTKKIGPAALPTGFVPSKTSKLPIKVSESSTPVIVNMSNQAKPSTSFGLNSQNYSFVIQDSGIKPSPHKNIVVDQRTGKRLSAVSYEQLVGNFGKNVAIKIPASFSGQKFISMSDLVVQNVQPVLNNQAVQMSKQPGQVMHTVPQDQNFTGIEEIIENDSSATFNAQTQNGAVSGNEHSDNYTLSHDDTILLGAQDEDLNEDSVNLGNYINSETKDPHDKESSHNNSEERYENDDETEKYENDAKTSPVHEIIHEAAASVRELNQDESLHHENCCRMCRRENRLLLQKVEALNQMVKEAIELLKEQRSSGGEKLSETDKKENADDSVEMEILMDLPLKTYAEFEEFSETIKSGGKIRRALTNELQDFKIKDDTAKSIRRMMAFLMTDQCADEMVWIQPREGTKKPAVRETYFIKYVTWVIKKTFPSDENVTNEYIETALQNWITRSSDRLRNATKKKSKKRSKQLPSDEPAQDDKNIPDEEFE